MQEIIDRAVKIATRYAMMGTPVERIIYIPAQSAASNDAFAIKVCPPLSAADTAPWEK